MTQRQPEVPRFELGDRKGGMETAPIRRGQRRGPASPMTLLLVFTILVLFSFLYLCPQWDYQVR